MAAASSAVALFTGRSSTALAVFVCSCPNAPKITFANERFMALDIFTERMKPDAPSSAPAIINSLLFKTNPLAAAVAKLKRAGVFLRQVRDQHAGPGIVGLVTEGAQVQRGRGSRGHQGTRQHIVALVDIELAGR